ncbi:MAG: S-methyl-5-thioribose-1-phosphate isomerase [Ignavibacteria bacterium]
MINKLQYTDSNEMIFLDQSLLPLKEKYIKTKDYKDVIDAITGLKIRGAPLIGIAAAYGIVLGVHNFKSENKKNLQIHFYKLIESFKNTRPTAKNLFYALERIKMVFENNIDKDVSEIGLMLLEEADRIYGEDIEMCKRIGINGSDLVAGGMNILTHCNTGELAAGGIGTAQGIVTTALGQAKDIFVYVCETRPMLQGSRLTAFELDKSDVKFELIIDSLAADLMKEGMIDCVLIGADRIASNGDVVNKVGSYSLAVSCAFHKVPLYVAAPSTTIDFEIDTGDSIEIEERDPDEIRSVGGNLIAGRNVKVLNPAFDLIPYNLVSAIITEYKIHYPPYNFGSLKHLFQSYIQSINNKIEN